MKELAEKLFLAKGYLWRVGMKRISWAVGKGAASFLAGPEVVVFLQNAGISVDQTKFQGAVPILILGALEFLHDWLKVKLPDSKYL